MTVSGRMRIQREARDFPRTAASLAGSSRIRGLSRVTILKGIRELECEKLPAERVRRPGAGRLRLENISADLPGILETLVEPLRRSDPESPLR